MPATAGRVRMPANNRVHSSAALQTHGIWQSAIGYDPYAPNKDENAKSSAVPQSSTVEPEGENAYASFQGLLALARITGSNADEARGACKKCGRVGHLTFQCRNFLSLKEKDDGKEKNLDGLQGVGLSVLDKLKGSLFGKVKGKKDEESETSEEEESESESSDSDVDSELERIIARRYAKKCGSKGRSLRKGNRDEDGSDSDIHSGDKKKRGRSKKSRNLKRESVSSDEDEDEDEGRRKKHREKRRKRDDSSDDEKEKRRSHRRKIRKEKKRRRSHRHSDDSDSDSDDYEDLRRRNKRKSKKAATPSDSDLKRSEKRSRKHHHEED